MCHHTGSDQQLERSTQHQIGQYIVINRTGSIGTSRRLLKIRMVKKTLFGTIPNYAYAHTRRQCIYSISNYEVKCTYSQTIKYLRTLRQKCPHRQIRTYVKHHLPFMRGIKGCQKHKYVCNCNLTLKEAYRRPTCRLSTMAQLTCTYVCTVHWILINLSQTVLASWDRATSLVGHPSQCTTISTNLREYIQN